MRSIERTLLAWMLGALTLGATLVALAVYLVTLEEMHEVFDADLKNISKAMASYHHAWSEQGRVQRIESPLRNDVPDDSEIVTLTWTPQGQPVFSSDPRVGLPFVGQEGQSRLDVNGEAWIVYSSISEDGVAQAAQRVAARQEMAAESASKIFPPMIGLVVVMGGLLVFGLRRSLRPLDSARSIIIQRNAQSLEPITSDDIPIEVAPLVSSINDLLSRLGAAFAVQRRFLADAAHELRTPVTALRLQLQRLERAKDDTSRAQALAELGAGIARSQRLIEQLLHVARTEPGGEALHPEAVDLAELVRSVVTAFSLKADRHGIDLGAKCFGSVTVDGDIEQLTVLLNNLIENALRYTPAGGVVDVEACLSSGKPALRVVDTGPGIPEAERERVFDRFSRGVDATSLARDGGGSGLGLAIVRAIADRHDAVISLQAPSQESGLEVIVRFPVAGSSPADAPA